VRPSRQTDRCHIRPVTLQPDDCGRNLVNSAANAEVLLEEGVDELRLHVDHVRRRDGDHDVRVLAVRRLEVDAEVLEEALVVRQRVEAEPELLDQRLAARPAEDREGQVAFGHKRPGRRVCHGAHGDDLGAQSAQQLRRLGQVLHHGGAPRAPRAAEEDQHDGPRLGESREPEPRLPVRRHELSVRQAIAHIDGALNEALASEPVDHVCDRGRQVDAILQLEEPDAQAGGNVAQLGELIAGSAGGAHVVLLVESSKGGGTE